MARRAFPAPRTVLMSCVPALSPPSPLPLRARILSVGPSALQLCALCWHECVRKCCRPPSALIPLWQDALSTSVLASIGEDATLGSLDPANGIIDNEWCVRISRPRSVARAAGAQPSRQHAGVGVGWGRVAGGLDCVPFPWCGRSVGRQCATSSFDENPVPVRAAGFCKS
jgi:hypothetical protein